jgi:hypothetical protein
VKAQAEEMQDEALRSDTEPLDPGAVARLAYFCWEARGCPNDSPDEDWFRAETELRNQLAGGAAA